MWCLLNTGPCRPAGQVKKDYAEEGLSIPAQREACQRKAAELNAEVNAEVLEEFVEAGVSGGSIGKRRSFQAMLRTIKQRGDIDYVIVWSVSRWARNQEDHWVARGMIDRANARLVSVTEQIGGASASEVMLEGIMAAVAAGRRLEIAEDVKRGIHRKAKVGGTPYRAPIGYVHVTKIEGGREIRDIALDPDRAPLVREAFTLYGTGEYSLDSLAAILEVRGLRSRATRRSPEIPLTANRLSSLLRNDYYLGSVTLNGKPYQGRHEPLITEALFEQVQSVLEGNRINGARAWKHHHYLAGTLFCAGCGGRLLFSRNKGKSGKAYEYFVCIGKQHGDCRQPYHRLEDLERAVEEFYGAHIELTETERTQLRTHLLDQLDGLAEVTEADLASAQGQEDRIEAQQEKLLQAHYADTISPELFGKEQRRLRKELVETRQLRARVEADLTIVQQNIECATDLLRDPADAYRRATPRMRGLMNRGYVRALYVDREEITSGELQPAFDHLLSVEVPRIRRARRGKPVETGRVSRTRNHKDPHAFFWRGGSEVESMVRAEGLEPPHRFRHQDLNLACLPISPRALCVGEGAVLERPGDSLSEAGHRTT